MIIEKILDLLLSLLKTLFGWINIPSLGSDFENSVAYIDTAFDNAQSLINFFLPWDFVKVFVPVIIVIVNFQHVYDFVMWILKKIPMLGIK